MAYPLGFAKGGRFSPIPFTLHRSSVFHLPIHNLPNCQLRVASVADCGMLSAIAGGVIAKALAIKYPPERRRTRVQQGGTVETFQKCNLRESQQQRPSAKLYFAQFELEN